MTGWAMRLFCFVPSAMLYSIKNIVLMGVVSKIRWSVVSGITVIVTNFHAVGLGAKKGQGHQRVNPIFAVHAIHTHRGSWVSIFVWWCGFHPAGNPLPDTIFIRDESVHRPYPAQVTDLVTGQVRDIFPDFRIDHKPLEGLGYPCV